MRPHGTRQRFSKGCKCDPCRQAWNAYNWNRIKARRAGDWRGSVSIERAKEHIAKLGNHKAIARIAGIHDSVIYRIVNDKITGIYKSTEDAILSVTKRDIDELWPLLADDGSFMPAAPVKRMIAELKASGFSDCELGRKASLKSGLRVLGKKYVRAYNAKRIEQIYRKSGVAA